MNNNGKIRNVFFFFFLLAQGLIGWWMVKSGLEVSPEERNRIRVSPYRLATHLGMAFTTFSLLIWTGRNGGAYACMIERCISKVLVLVASCTNSGGFKVNIHKTRLRILKGMLMLHLELSFLICDYTGLDALNPRPHLEKLAATPIDAKALQKLVTLRRTSIGAFALVGTTVLSGAFVAGNDAGLAYNTFPKMGDEWFPSEGFAIDPWYRNFFEDTPTVQFDHRVLALSSAGVISSMYLLARRRDVWSVLPPQAKAALNSAMGMVAVQVRRT